MSSTTYYQRNRDVMLTKQARDKYHNMSEEKKTTKRISKKLS